MKKFFTVVLIVLTSLGIAKADNNERTISVEQLPQKAQEFLKTYFKDLTVAFIVEETKYYGKEYEVTYTDRTEIDFQENGEWEKIKCRYTAVPSGIVPKAIIDFVAKNNPQQTIKKIERNAYIWEVELHNGIEIKFDTKFQLIGYDD